MQDYNLFLLIAVLTALFSYVAVNWVRLQLYQHLLDVPNARSSHVTPTPRGGGLGFIAAFMIAISVYNLCFSTTLPTLPLFLWLPFLPLFVIGLLDDWKSVSAALRYFVQLAVAIMLVWEIGAFPLPWLENLGTGGIGLAFIATVIGLTAAMNFYNFMDGLDGLVAGCCIVQVSYCALYLNQPSLWLLSAALFGFLVLNWSPAKIFMGDAGSTFLGAIIPACLLLAARSPANHTPVESWSSLVVTLPLVLDALYTLLSRWRQGENIFEAHKSHLYQRLNQAGFSHAKVAGAYICVTSIFAASLLLLGPAGAIMSLIALGLVLFCSERLIKSQLASVDLSTFASTK